MVHLLNPSILHFVMSYFLVSWYPLSKTFDPCLHHILVMSRSLFTAKVVLFHNSNKGRLPCNRGEPKPLCKSLCLRHTGTGELAVSTVAIVSSPPERVLHPMGPELGAEQTPQRKLRLLGLHGFRTNGAILRQQLSKWGPALNDLFEVDCLDAPLPCSGKSEVEALFNGPYYEWYRFNKDYTEFYHVDEKLFSYVTDYMKLHGPYDGFIGFSQGAALSGCLAALQEKGLALQDVPPIRLLVLMAPAQLRAQHLKHVYEGPTIKCPTLAFLGDKDWLRYAGVEVLKSFENNVTICHRSGHTVPRLDEAQTATAAQFLKSQLAAIDASDAAPRIEVEVPEVALEGIDKTDAVQLRTTNVITDSHHEEISVAA